MASGLDKIVFVGAGADPGAVPDSVERIERRERAPAPDRGEAP